MNRAMSSERFTYHDRGARNKPVRNNNIIEFWAPERLMVAERPLANKPRLLDQVRDVIRVRHYSLRTERTYCDWIVRFIRFHNLRHPRDMGDAEVTAFLTHLARKGKVAASTQNQALSALLFLYKEVLRQNLGYLQGVERAKRPSRLPVVLTRDDVHKIFAHMHGMYRLMAGLLYGSGL